MCRRLGQVAFSAPYPGKVIRFPLQGSSIVCQRGSFLCATRDINISVEFTRRLGAGFFGGEGFILERFEGGGEVFAHSGGTIVPFDLKAGEKLKVGTGCLVAFDPTVDYDIQFVGGIKTALFGGEWLFFALMTGPGRIWVQTLPFSRLADRILAAQHGGKGEVRRGNLGGALGAIGDLISGDE